MQPARRREAGGPRIVPKIATGIEGWFERRAWKPYDHQLAARAAYREGRHGILVQATGAGKTVAALWGPLEAIASQGRKLGTVRLLYLSPLRSLARDLAVRIEELVNEAGFDLRVELRSGDTAASKKRGQKLNPPDVLVTTVESLGILLSDPDSKRMFEGVEALIVDEWHSYLGSKRAVQLGLYATRLRRLAPRARLWAMSATVRDPEEALLKLLPMDAAAEPRAVIASDLRKELHYRLLLPNPDEPTLPWAGFFGLRLGETLLRELDPDQPSLIFVNTRAQAELWYQYLKAARPEWVELLALHHGSLDLKRREDIENGLLAREIRICVCTSSLELGIDFPPIERVFHIGSPKGVSRLLQRAGRSNHTAELAPDLTVLPVNVPDLFEVRAAIAGAKAGRIEAAPPEGLAWDVLAQHFVTCALGGGFEADAMFEEARACPFFADLAREDFDKLLQVAEQGGASLAAYPLYRRIGLSGSRYLAQNKKVAMLHRMNLSTIPSTTSVELRFEKGNRALGFVEEGFMAKLRKGDSFVFAGKTLEFTRMKDFKAYVKLRRSPTERTLHWQGTRMPFSPVLGDELRAGLEALNDGVEPVPEARTWVEAQKRRSVIPARDELLVECLKFKGKGEVVTFYLVEGQETHEGLGALFAWRIMKQKSASLRVLANDWAVGLAGDADAFEDIDLLGLLSPEGLEQDLEGALNLRELARRRFRDIARVAGLVYQNLPQAERKSRQLQASAGLLFDLFMRYEPEHPLVKQAFEEVRRRELDLPRIAAVLERARSQRPIVKVGERATPFSFPVWVQRHSQAVSNVSMEERIERLQRELFR